MLSSRDEPGLAVKRLYAFLMRLKGFDSFLIRDEFELTLMEHDLDAVWKAIGSEVRRESNVAILIPGYTGYAQDTLLRFLDQGIKTDMNGMLRFLDETLTKFSKTASVEIELSELKDRLTDLGYSKQEISRTRLLKSPVVLQKETIIAEEKPYEAYKLIAKIIHLCKRELAIIDPWIDEDVFPLYLESVPASASIKIITRNMMGKFGAIAKRFSLQRKQFEVRLFDVHDRHLIVDDRAWIIGQSIKDAGKKPLSIIELSDVDQVKTVFDKLWNSSKKVM